MQSHERKERESFGPCPRCGKPVVKTGRIWQCSTNRREKQADGSWKDTGGCGWKLFATVAGKTLTDVNVRKLLAGSKVRLKGFKSKAGKTFDAALVIDKDRGTTFDFNNR